MTYLKLSVNQNTYFQGLERHYYNIFEIISKSKQLDRMLGIMGYYNIFEIISKSKL